MFILNDSIRKLMKLFLKKNILFGINLLLYKLKDVMIKYVNFFNINN